MIYLENTKTEGRKENDKESLGNFKRDVYGESGQDKRKIAREYAKTNFWDLK